MSSNEHGLKLDIIQAVVSKQVEKPVHFDSMVFPDLTDYEEGSVRFTDPYNSKVYHTFMPSDKIYASALMCADQWWNGYTWLEVGFDEAGNPDDSMVIPKNPKGVLQHVFENQWGAVLISYMLKMGVKDFTLELRDAMRLSNSSSALMANYSDEGLKISIVDRSVAVAEQNRLIAEHNAKLESLESIKH